MHYDEAASFLFDLRRFQVSPGTESVRDLLGHLGDPHEDVSFVQVAGSNGKGSTARMVESVLREAGLAVGLYTSPHLDDLRERVRVDGRKIPRSAVAEFVESAEPFLVDRAAEGDPLTFFETVTAMALWQFGRRDVDVAVLEVGLGGRYDATSVVDPVAAAVTNVSLEHTDVLGDTLAEITVRKAAVAPADAPLVTGATGEALEGIRAICRDVVTVDEAGAPDGESDDGPNVESDGAADERDGANAQSGEAVGDEANDARPDGRPDVRVTYEGRAGHAESRVRVDGAGFDVSARLPMLGAYQARNAGVAAALAAQVTDVDATTLRRGLRSAHWPGRFEVMDRDPLVVFDGAHNPAACAAVAETLAEFDGEFDALHLVVGAMHDKDHRGMAAALPTADSVTTCAPDLDRAEDPAVLARVFENAGHRAVRTGGSVADAFAAALESAAAEDCRSTSTPPPPPPRSSPGRTRVRPTPPAPATRSATGRSRRDWTATPRGRSPPNSGRSAASASGRAPTPTANSSTSSARGRSSSSVASPTSSTVGRTSRWASPATCARRCRRGAPATATRGRTARWSWASAT